ncbi:MAG: carbohydrate binding domain-containing protein [Oscillospiraceae bacterium]|nr:carbohydrate binding domain-containing protein [Oscillospiraceae bacterium]
MKQIWKKHAAFSAGVMLAASALSGIPAAPVSAAELLTAEFETTNDSFTGRGGASVQWTSDESNEGTCSLYVSNREKEWHGASRDASSLMAAGQTYAMSAAVYQLSGEPVEMKFSLQYTGSDGQPAYDKIALETVESGKWTVLANAEYKVPDGASDLVIYVETTKSLTSFYLDTVTAKGAPAVIKKGDANGDLRVDVLDAVQLARFLVTETDEIEPGADYDGDGAINAKDLSMLKHALLFPTVTPIVGDWDNYVETASPAMQKVYQDGVYRVGNTARIREKIAKAQAGENVTIGYIGGSITGGGSATSDSKRYVNLASDYFSKTFGQGNNVRFVNAGVAGTSSVVGNMRVDKDIFAQNCDIIFIEFAVNDQDGDRFKKSYEALVKKCLMQENAPAVILITLCQKSGGSCQDWMVKIGENYDLAVISGKNAIMNAISAGTLSWDANYGSGDTIHPGDGGHQLIADCISYYYRRALRSENASDDYQIPSKTVFGDEYATAHLVNMSSLQNFSAGSWTAGTNNREYGGYTYSKNGNNPMTFTVNGKGILLLFQSNSSGMGSVNVTVNGKTNKVSSNLQWTWGGLDGDVGYYQTSSGQLDVSISSADNGTFVLYGIAVID